MTDHNAAFSPARWLPAPKPGVWTKELLRSDGDSFTLLRLGRGAGWELTGGADDRILVLEGDLDDGERRGRGAYRPASGVKVSSEGGCLALVLSGTRLGAPADDVFSPEGWQESSTGVWFRLLLDVTFDEGFDERVVGLSYFEPGSTAPRHPHRTAHRFLFLDGEADDELVFPDGTRQVFQRRRGDFVDYPHPVEHQSFSRTGCLILFLHEPVR
ncbi:cupin domain-containing protein [Amycolatopsis dongchuanensis]|uniref:ChrR-like cupin domain-containing protein n=1 Tax=Amycolatopsis dongchuanensis TaxID=1070866 RepID=A0ABP9QAK6_9PSEU